MLGSDLRELRRLLDFTQAEAAEWAGVKPNTWARWERDEINPRLQVRLPMERALRALRAAEQAVKDREAEFEQARTSFALEKANTLGEVGDEIRRALDQTRREGRYTLVEWR